MMIRTALLLSALLLPSPALASNVTDLQAFLDAQSPDRRAEAITWLVQPFMRAALADYCRQRGYAFSRLDSYDAMEWAKLRGEIYEFDGETRGLARVAAYELLDADPSQVSPEACWELRREALELGQIYP